MSTMVIFRNDHGRNFLQFNSVTIYSTRLQFLNIKFIAKASTLFWCTVLEYFPGSSFDILGKAEQVIAHRGKN